MNGPQKINTKTSKESILKRSDAKKTQPSPRNPLKELNRGCFGFLRSNSNSRDSFQGTKTLQRTPKSAPPNARTVDSKNSGNDHKYRGARKIGTNSNLDAVKQTTVKKSSRPKVPSRNSSLNGRESDKGACFKGQCGKSSEKIGLVLTCTPEKSVLEFDENYGFGAVVEQKLISTPTSATTPPIESSISPEVTVEGSAVGDTPVCFANGHLLAGVQDRRKCRPRGILTVGSSEPEAEKVHKTRANPSRVVSPSPPPIAGASMHWLSSPSENSNSAVDGSHCSSGRAHLGAEASVNWFLSPCDKVQSLRNNDLFCRRDNVMEVKPLYDYDTWKFSPTDSGVVEPMEFQGVLGSTSLALESTPPSGIDLQKTPTTGSSVSPFSMIIERVAKTSKFKFNAQQERVRAGYRYGSALENSPFSRDSMIESNVSCTPCYSSSKKEFDLNAFEMDKVLELVDNFSLSPTRATKVKNHQQVSSGVSSFQFRCQEEALHSVDLKHFKNPPCHVISSPTEILIPDKDLTTSQTRISWREGLVSRMFEMGELDWSQWLSDDEGNFNHHEDVIQSIQDINFDSFCRESILEHHNNNVNNAGFGSIEFACETAVEKSKENNLPLEPISCAESISLEEIELVSSGDSEWTLFYKNDLFTEISKLLDSMMERFAKRHLYTLSERAKLSHALHVGRCLKLEKRTNSRGYWQSKLEMPSIPILFLFFIVSNSFKSLVS